MKISACIFDLDGVICDTARYHYLAWKELADSLQIPFTPQDNERLKGVSRMASLDIILEMGGLVSVDAAKKAHWMQQKNARYIAMVSSMTQDELLPGAQDFLKELRRCGIKTALGSASKNASLILARLGIAGLFDAVVDGTHVAKPKPAPDVFLQGARQLHISPTECLVFEDAAAGVQAALAGGMRCIGVGSPDVLVGACAWIPGFAGLCWDEVQRIAACE